MSETDGQTRLSFEQELLALMREQGEAIKKMAITMESIQKHVVLDEQPFPSRDIEHEPAWEGVFKTRTASTNEQVEIWKSGMDADLIFIALFVTIVTAFQAPVTDNLTRDPLEITNHVLNNLSTIVFQLALLNGLKVPNDLPELDAFKPKISDQIITLFYYTSLILSIVTAILAVFGRQWLNSLTRMPEDSSYLQKTMRHRLRQRFAETILKPILDSLHPTLIISISFFVVGLLYQLWNLTFKGPTTPALLIVTSSVGSLLSLILGLVVAATVSHAIYYEESPFASPLTSMIRRILPRSLAKPFSGINLALEDDKAWSCLLDTVSQITETDYLDQISSIIKFKYSFSDDLKTSLSDSIIRLLASDTSARAKISVSRNLEWPEFDNGDSDKRVPILENVFVAFYDAYVTTPINQTILRRYLFLGIGRVLSMFNRDCTILLQDPRDSNPFSAELPSFCVYLSKVLTGMDNFLNFERERLGVFHNSAFEEAERIRNSDPEAFEIIIENLEISGIGALNDNKGLDFILPRLSSVQVTQLLDSISSRSKAASKRMQPEQMMDDIHMVSINLIGDILRLCRKPFILPTHFDISNSILAFLPNTVDNFLEPNWYWDDTLETLLVVFSLMNKEQLADNQGVVDLLDRVIAKRPEVEEWSCLGEYKVNVRRVLAEATESEKLIDEVSEKEG